MAIKPTVGRVVWYWAEGYQEGVQPQAGIVTYVHSDDLVNLAVFAPNGSAYPHTSVRLMQHQEHAARGECSWMPYQLGQAARTEAAEKARGE
jgi:hypothetical protein